VPQATPWAKAIGCVGQWQALLVYLQDGGSEHDKQNSLGTRRPWGGRGRRNWPIVGSDEGGEIDRAAVLLQSVLASF